MGLAAQHSSSSGLLVPGRLVPTPLLCQLAAMPGSSLAGSHDITIMTLSNHVLFLAGVVSDYVL